VRGQRPVSQSLKPDDPGTGDDRPAYITYTTTIRTFLGEFEQLLLLALAAAPGEAYGVEVRRAIEERAGRTVSPGAVYTALDRLERRGLVSSRLGDPTPERGGKRKRYYRLEPAGAELLARTRAALARMAGDAVPLPDTP
jgi:DNA-binding PadR family transcriptional regulator